MWVNSAGGLILYALVYPVLLIVVASVVQTELAFYALLVVGVPLVWLYFHGCPYEAYVDWLGHQWK